MKTPMRFEKWRQGNIRNIKCQVDVNWSIFIVQCAEGAMFRVIERLDTSHSIESFFKKMFIQFLKVTFHLQVL